MFMRRGLLIFNLGLLTAIVTLLCTGDDFIIFGVLHCIGLSIMTGFFLC